MNAVELAELCTLQMALLGESVREWYPYKDEYFTAGYETPKNGQANKTAIRRQVTALRQSLLALEKEVNA